MHSFVIPLFPLVILYYERNEKIMGYIIYIVLSIVAQYLPFLKDCIYQYAEYRKLKLLLDAGITCGTVTKNGIEFGEKQ